MSSRAVDDRRRFRRRQSPAVEHAQHTAGNRARPLRDNLGGGLSRRNPWAVGARRGQRLAVGPNDAGDPRVTRPPYRDAPFWSPQSWEDTTLSAAKNERQRPGPARDHEPSGITRQMQIEAERVVSSHEDRKSTR